MNILKLIIKSAFLLIAVAITYSAFMFVLDPYCIVRADYDKKELPYFPMYNYNFIKHHKKIDYGFLGSSAVNYFPIDSLYPGKIGYSMGIESSNINEHIAYGKVLAAKKPKEIIFFITFYALNPARSNQNYFHPFVIKMNNPALDFADQYFNKGAYDDACKYLQERKRTKSDWVQEFNLNGTRTQNVYLMNKEYDVDKTFAYYLAYMYTDPKYYASQTFENPASINKGIAAIRDFCSYLKNKNISVKLAIAPEHRLNMALVYYSGLGKSYEEFRRQLASVQPFYDLNSDTAFTSRFENFWDTHHSRRGIKIMKDLNDKTFLVTTSNVDENPGLFRPSENEMTELKKIFKEYNNWDKIRKEVQKELAITPAAAS